MGQNAPANEPSTEHGDDRTHELEEPDGAASRHTAESEPVRCDQGGDECDPKMVASLRAAQTLFMRWGRVLSVWRDDRCLPPVEAGDGPGFERFDVVA
jgi:hypothetical protein